MEDARQAFSERVPTRFPVGSAETELRTELQHQGFKIEMASANRAPYSLVAIVDNPGICRNTWVILWDAQNNQITRITGEFAQVCL